jgi:tetratricopeptide (TPR) repeat protein
MRKVYVFLAVIFLIFPLYAETIKLKSGKKIEAKIIKRTDTHLKIDMQGIPLTYYLDEIDSIDGSTVGSASTPPPQLTARGKPTQDILETAQAAMVYITGERGQMDTIGSGFIVDKKGVVLTAYHVAANAKNLGVKLKNGKTYPVTDIVSYDRRKDFCLLKIASDNLPVIPLGDSANVRQNDKIYLLGNPLGLEFMLSSGTVTMVISFQGAKRIAVAISGAPGSSGGPILNAQGEVVGIAIQGVVQFNNIKALAINEIKPFMNAPAKMSIAEFSSKPDEVALLVSNADRAAFRRDFQQAINGYKNASSLEPDDALLQHNIGCGYMELGKPQEAIPYLQKAIQLEPNYADSIWNLGSACTALKQYDQALPNFRKLIELCPNESAGYAGIGVVYGSTGEYEQALPYFQKAEQLNPNDVQMQFNLGLAYSKLGKYSQAEPHFQKIIQLDPKSADAYARLGIIYRELGKNAEAKENIKKAIELYRARGDYKSAQTGEEELKKIP